MLDIIQQRELGVSYSSKHQCYTSICYKEMNIDKLRVTVQCIKDYVGSYSLN